MLLFAEKKNTETRERERNCIGISLAIIIIIGKAFVGWSNIKVRFSPSLSCRLLREPKKKTHSTHRWFSGPEEAHPLKYFSSGSRIVHQLTREIFLNSIKHTHTLFFPGSSRAADKLTGGREEDEKKIIKNLTYFHDLRLPHRITWGKFTRISIVSLISWRRAFVWGRVAD